MTYPSTMKRPYGRHERRSKQHAEPHLPLVTVQLTNPIYLSTVTVGDTPHRGVALLEFSADSSDNLIDVTAYVDPWEPNTLVVLDTWYPAVVNGVIGRVVFRPDGRRH